MIERDLERTNYLIKKLFFIKKKLSFSVSQTYDIANLSIHVGFCNI